MAHSSAFRKIIEYLDRKATFVVLISFPIGGEIIPDRFDGTLRSEYVSAPAVVA